jgi:hypothetical protein
MAKGNPNPKTDHLPEVNTKHGAYRLQRLAVSEWPPELQTRYQERYAEIADYPHIDPELYKGAISQLVRTEFIVGLCHNWLYDHGVISENGSIPPVLTMLPLWENSLSRMYQSLGLTPLASERVKARAIVQDGFPERLARWREQGDLWEDKPLHVRIEEARELREQEG